MRMKKVSVIIPIYKVETYLRECVDSVLCQTYHELEIILVDDGSPDNCGAICDEYAARDERIHVIHKSNGGQSDARNAGLRVASGDYFCCIDSDDYIMPEAIERLVQKAESTQSDIVVFDAENFFEEGFAPAFCESLVHRYHYEIASGPTVLNQMFEHRDYNCSACTHFYSARFIRENRLFYVKGLLFEDLMFNGIAFLRAKKVCVINEHLYMRRLRKGSTLNSKGSLRKVQSYRYIVLRFLDEYRMTHNSKKKKALSYLIALAANMSLIRYADVVREEEIAARKEVLKIRNMIQPYDYFGSKKVKLKMQFISAFRFYRRAKDNVIRMVNELKS